MIGKHKKFEKSLYNKYDGPAKQAMRVHLELMGHDVTVPPENYGPDLYSITGFRKCYHEVEVSLKWKLNMHPFGLGSIPERKIRLLDKIGDCELFFWMLRLDLKRALVFPSTVLQEQYLVEVPNIKIETGEYFYRVPKTLGKEFDLACIKNG
jgi:hypothetical protein